MEEFRVSGNPYVGYGTEKGKLYRAKCKKCGTYTYRHEHFHVQRCAFREDVEYIKGQYCSNCGSRHQTPFYKMPGTYYAGWTSAPSINTEPIYDCQRAVFKRNLTALLQRKMK